MDIKTPGKGPEKCYVCGSKTDSYCINILEIVTKTSETKIYELVERFLGHKLPEYLDDLKTTIVCLICIKKFDDYDEAYSQAIKIQEQLTTLIQEKDNHDEDPEEIEESHEIKPELDMLDNSTEFIFAEDIYLKEEELPIIIAPAVVTAKPVIMKCTTCNEVFKNLSEMKVHSHKKQDKSQYEAETTYEVDYLTEQSKIEPIESTPIDRVSLLKKNRKPLIPHKCSKCNKEFLARTEFKLHLKTHDDQEKFMCDICGMSYKSISGLQVHVLLHKGRTQHWCTVCGKKFTQKGALVRHMPIHTGEKHYQCDKCGKQFLHYSSFHMHQMAHDNIREKKCPICGFELRSNSHLTRHMRVHSGEKPFECPTCGQKFAQRYNMMTHLKAHQGIYRDYAKPYICPVCNLPFQRKLKLQEHLLYVHNTVVDPSTLKPADKSKKKTNTSINIKEEGTIKEEVLRSVSS